MAFADNDGFEVEPLVAQQRADMHCSLARGEELYWAGNYWKESFFRTDYDYEDYAPAFCVGYSGCAQYGGHFEDSETSLFANFLRIKGDSRLTWEEARAAIRAGWERVRDSDDAATGWKVSRIDDPSVEPQGMCEP